MSEPADNPPPNEAAQIQAQIDRMNELLAQGAEAVKKVDQFYRDHDLVPGIGEKMLTGNAVSDRDREIFRRLIAEVEMMEERLLQFEQADKQPASVSASVKAIGNRYRI